MAFSRINPSGFSFGQKLSSAQMTQLDIDHSQALDKSPAGDQLQGVISMTTGAQILAQVPNAIVASGPQAIVGIDPGTIQSRVVGAFSHNAGPNDWNTFGVGGTAPRSRTLFHPLIPLNGLMTGFSRDGSGFFLVGNGNGQLQHLVLPRPHQGSRIVSATIYFQVGASHSGAPTTTPGIGIERFDATGAFSHEVGFQQVPPPASGAAWYAGGLPQSFTTTVGTGNTVDCGQYYYILTISDEGGTNAVAGNIYTGVSVLYDSIADMRFP